MTEEEEAHAVRMALAHLDLAEHALGNIQRCFPADHPTADDELLTASQALADVRDWLEG